MAAGCKKNNETAMSNIDKKCVEKTIEALSGKYADIDGIDDRIARGVGQVAALWTDEDGTPAEFEAFCGENFVADPGESAGRRF